MPATTVLHIQGRDEAPPRVVELDRAAIRVGRGRHCEIRLTGPRLADVHCILRRQGEGWQIQPVGPPGALSIYGEPIGKTRGLDLNVPLRVGDYWLTLRPVSPALGSFDAPIDVDFEPDSDDGFNHDEFRPLGLAGDAPSEPEAVAPIAPSPAEAELAAEAARLREWQAQLEEKERSLQARQAEKKWEARWRAAGEKLRKQPEIPPRPTPSTPIAPEVRPSIPKIPRVSPTIARPRVDTRVSTDRPHVEPRKPRPVPTPPPSVERSGGWDLNRETPTQPEAPATSVTPRPVEVQREQVQPPTHRPIRTASFLTPPSAPSAPDDWAEESTQPEELEALGWTIDPAPVATTASVAVEAEIIDVEPIEDSAPEAEIEVETSPKSETVFGDFEFMPLLQEPAPEPAARVEAEPPAPGPGPVAPALDLSPFAHWYAGPHHVSATHQADRFAPTHSTSTRIEPWEMPETASAAVRLDERPSPSPFEAMPTARPAREQPVYEPEPKVAEEPRTRIPSAGEILAAQRTRVVPEPTTRRKVASCPRPTESRAPESWNAPFWLAMVPALALTVGFGGACLGLAALWTLDDQAAAVATSAALRAPTDPGANLDPQLRPNPAWYRTTPTHLAAWAIAIERSPEGASAREETNGLLESARHIAPLHPATRYALAQTARPDEPQSQVATLGLPRDGIGLALTARRLKASGKAKDALRLYRDALSLSAEAEPNPKEAPTFDEDPRVRRYRLLEESAPRAIAEELVESNDWPYAEWREAVPADASVRLAVARLMRDKGRPEAGEAFDAVLALPEAPEGLPGEELAARAEALSFRERPEESAKSYEKAIAAAPDDRAARLWSYNLAEILRPMSRESDRTHLLQAATGGPLDEDVTRRALDAQSLSGPSASGLPASSLDRQVQPAQHESAGDQALRRGAP